MFVQGKLLKSQRCGSFATLPRLDDRLIRWQIPWLSRDACGIRPFQMETICSRLKTVMGLITLLLFVQSAQALELEPGVTFRLFDIQEPMQVLTPLVLGQIPNIDELRPEVDFSTLEAFSGFKEQFVVEVSGFLLTEVPGKYVLRLISDDGSILKVDDRVVIRNWSAAHC